ncbi:MAG: hypothetical protein A3J76_00300 [Candidatus Moranbacteria bacterium RBG_13_45_13]|nr:MAG: hypothetical protein A3J76_00300 [Candidatus Moranbacteria bacterium RBG_13_45_13]
MLGDLLVKEKISTTEAKAKELVPLAEKFINQTKKISSSDKTETIRIVRSLHPKLPHQMSLAKLKSIAERFQERRSGYFRIIKSGQRRSDGAKMAILELIKKTDEKQ